MKIEIWSDVVCPFCYIGKRNFEKSLEDFKHQKDIEIEWKSFQLDPSFIQNPNEKTDNTERLSKKYNKPYKPLLGVCLSTILMKEIESDTSIKSLDDNDKNLFIFGENDVFTKHIRLCIQNMNLMNTKTRIIMGAGHLFNSSSYEQQVNEMTIKWIRSNIASE